MATKNYAVSNKARLLNITRQKEGLTFMQVLLRFIHERFLYRLSVSDYREHFFLKGGALLYAHEKFEARLWVPCLSTCMNSMCISVG